MAKVSKKATKKTSTKANGKVNAAPKTPTVKRQTWSDTAKEPKGTVMDACIDLLRKKDGAGIKDFQEVKGFAYPSIAVLRAAEGRGYKVKVVKVEGSPKRYFATGTATK